VNSPVVSVIVPTYGRPQYLQSALWSVMLQTFPDWECIVVDDAGDQPSELPNDPRFRWIKRSINGGPGAARNTGVAASRGRYIAFLDDDDIWTPMRLHAGLGAARQDPTAITIVQIGRFDEAGVELVPVHRWSAKYQARQLAGQFPSVGQVLIPRELMKPFDESLRTAEDADWWLQMSGAAPLRISMTLGYLAREHPEARPGVHRETTLQNRIRVYRKHQEFLRRHRRARAHAADRIASAALRLGSRRMSAAWATRSLSAFPNVHAARVLRRAVIGQRRSTRN
jgi:glycosyltransferase involved in cell wall biosynthesis